MLIDEIKTQMVAAMKAKDTDRRNVLKVALGDVQMGATRKGADLTDDETAAIVKKIIKGNEETIQANVDDETKARLLKEVDILSALLPQTMDVNAIVAALEPVKDNIQAADNDGMATGIAMKHLKSQQAAVEGKDVAQAVKAIRS